jgi:hypothetical protein
MATPDNWRKSSYSGPGDGDSCVEIANNLTQVAIRDSKTPARATLTFPTGAFTTFVDGLKGTPDNWRKSSYSDGDDGNDCVEIANSPTHVAIRDSKTPARATLTFPIEAFAPFIDALRSRSRTA